jgi:N-acetylmuramoyl-L-alanine amidase
MQNNCNISIFVRKQKMNLRNFLLTRRMVLLMILLPVFAPVCSSALMPEGSSLDVVVIDPGHGGKDFGTSLGAIREKDIVLDIGLRLGRYIREAFPEIRVVYTREKDLFVPLHERARIANGEKADLFLSIHMNYTDIRSVSGTETFVLGYHRSRENLEIAKKENAVILLEDNYTTTYEGFDPNAAESYIMFEMLQDEYLDQSLQFATAIQSQVSQRTRRKDRGVKQAGFLVLRETTMPGVLIETGFISNETDKNFLVSEAGKIDIAYSIFEAFCQYKNKIEEKSRYLMNILPPANPEFAFRESDTLKDEQIAEVLPEKNPNDNLRNPEREKIWFSVQVVASDKPYELHSAFFQGEKEVFEVKADPLYKYCIGHYNSYNKASGNKNRLRKKFNGAFVVAFRGDQAISIKEALEKTKK